MEIENSVKYSSLQDSILKEILNSRNCSVGKYLAPMFCSSKTGGLIEYFITPVVTISKCDILIISNLIKGNWYQALLNVEVIVNSIKKQYNFSYENYKVILHAFFDVVALEKFYLIDINDKYKLQELKLTEFEDMLN
jgi:hypothetical protein